VFRIMAKKKAKKTNKPNYTGWIVAALIVLVIIILVVKMKPLETKTPTGPSDVTTPGKVTAAVAAPVMVAKCSTSYVIGVASKCTMSGSDAKMPVINSGRGTIPGMWFAVTGVGGEVKYFKSSESMNMKETKAYTLELSKWSSELGSAVKSVTLYPMTSDGKACDNQKISQQVEKCA
jgi:hypothetical protein